MALRESTHDSDIDLFRQELVNLIDMRHELAVLSSKPDWAALEAKFGGLYAAGAAQAQGSQRRRRGQAQAQGSSAGAGVRSFLKRRRSTGAGVTQHRRRGQVFSHSISPMCEARNR
jgi:hypothetical protein